MNERISFPSPLKIELPNGEPVTDYRSASRQNLRSTFQAGDAPDKGEPISIDEFLDESHHGYYGGPWSQGLYTFLCMRHFGLKPTDKVLDLGCGSGRVGIWLIPYLEVGCYFGVDSHLRSLAAFASYEAVIHDLAARSPRLMLSAQFEFANFGVRFNGLLDASVTHHLKFEQVEYAYSEAAKLMDPGAKVYIPHAPRLPIEKMSELGFDLSCSEPLPFAMFRESTKYSGHRPPVWHVFTRR